MNEIKSILEVIRKMKTTVILILFVVFVLFYYKPLITEVVETKVKKPDEVKKDINNNVLIQQMLNDLLLKYKADRAYIFRFHNGIVYFDGKHKNHQSLSFEVCGRGISSEKMELQNLPTSLYPIFLQEVMLNKMIYQDVNDIKENATRISLKEQGIKSLIAAPVFKDGYFVSYVGLDYVKECMPLNIDYHEFKKNTDEIGRLLVD
jgi:hypothetical protein